MTDSVNYKYESLPSKFAYSNLTYLSISSPVTDETTDFKAEARSLFRIVPSFSASYCWHARRKASSLLS